VSAYTPSCSNAQEYNYCTTQNVAILTHELQCDIGFNRNVKLYIRENSS